jgi:hypothetical protein
MERGHRIAAAALRSLWSFLVTLLNNAPAVQAVAVFLQIKRIEMRIVPGSCKV